MHIQIINREETPKTSRSKSIKRIVRSAQYPERELGKAYNAKDMVKGDPLERYATYFIAQPTVTKEIIIIPTKRMHQEVESNPVFPGIGVVIKWSTNIGTIMSSRKIYPHIIDRISLILSEMFIFAF